MKIIIKKGFGYIRPIPEGKLANLLESKFKYTKKGVQFMPNPLWGIVKLYKIKTGKFPVGFLKDVKNYIQQYIEQVEPDQTLEVENQNAFGMGGVVEYKTPLFSLRPYQSEAVDSFLSEKRGVIALATGLGKTLTALHIINRLKKKTLVIVHTKDLMDQWDREIKKHIHDNPKQKELGNISIYTIQTLSKNPKLLVGFDFIIIDEAHHVAADMMYKTGLHFTQEYVLGLSATPTREDGNEMKLFGVMGQVIYCKNTKWGIDNGYLVPAEVKWIELQKHKPAEPMEYPETYKDYIVENVERNAAIINECVSRDLKTLVLVKEIEHGKKLQQLLCLGGEDVIFLHGKIKVKDTTPRIIIATSIFDEGVDLPAIEMVVMGVGGKSSIKTIQRVGRGLRPSPGKTKLIVIDFMDKAKWLISHSRERAKIYKRELE